MYDWKATLSGENWAYDATLSSPTTWETELPLTNLNAYPRVLSDKARTTGAVSGVRINGVFSRPRPVSIIGLYAHNLSVNAQCRYRLYADAADVGTESGMLGDSGLVDAWPPVYSFGEVEWEDPQFWTGQPSDEERAQFTAYAHHVFDPYQMCEAFTIDIEDPDNPDEYIEAGLVHMAKLFQFATNISFGAQTGFEVKTEVAETRDGGERFDIRKPRRFVNISAEYMEQAEAYGIFSNTQRKLGVHGEIFFAMQLLRDAQYYTRTFLGRFEKLDPIAHPTLARFSSAATLKELT